MGCYREKGRAGVTNPWFLVLSTPCRSSQTPQNAPLIHMEERAAVFQLQLLFVLVVWFVGGWPPAQRLEAGFSVVVGGGGVGGGGGRWCWQRPTDPHSCIC